MKDEEDDEVVINGFEREKSDLKSEDVCREKIREGFVCIENFKKK